MFYLFRNPMFQEDEGRSLFCGKYETRELAQARIEQEVRESKGWLTEGCFTITRPENVF